MTEIWRDVPGYEGIYEVSSEGRFRSKLKRMRTRAGDILNGSQYKNGYRYIRLTDHQGVKKRHLSHRLVLRAFAPLPGWEGLDVNHANGMKGDNRLSNLAWMTHRENIIHARQTLKAWPEHPKKIRVRKGPVKGEAIPNAKLNPDRVREIRHLWSTGLEQHKIAKMFDVASSTICMIVNHKQWAHVE